MKYGFLKVAAATIDTKVGNCGHNSSQIKKEIDKALADGVQMIVFPELSITGYSCGDLFLQQRLIDNAKSELVNIAKSTNNKDIIVIVGLPIEFEGKLYNAAAVIYDGEIMGIVPKSFIPNHAEFNEGRYFSSGKGVSGDISFEYEMEEDDDFSEGFNLKLSYAGKTGEVNISDSDYEDEEADYEEDEDEEDDDFEIEQEVSFGTDILFKAVNIPNFIFAVEISQDFMVANPPSVRHALAGATVIVNLSAASEGVGKRQYRRNLLSAHSKRTLVAYIYANAGEGESTTDLVFSGHNLIYESGELISEANDFENSIIYGEIDLDKIVAERRVNSTFIPEGRDEYYIADIYIDNTEDDITRQINKSPFVPISMADRDARCEEIFSIQVRGLKKRLAHTNCKSAVVGISGGLDSTLALLVTVKAFDMLGLDRKDIIAVTMPGFGTTDRTYTNALALIKELGATLKEVNISEAVKLHFEQIGHDINVHNVTYENAQARQRTYLLMDFANVYNGLVVGTGDLSELALGWATYNGDHMSMYGVNGGVPKTFVRHLVEYYAKNCGVDKLEIVLRDVLDTPVSPELLPPQKDGTIAQKTEDLVGPYELHDFFMYNILRFGYAPDKVFYLAKHAFVGVYDEPTIEKWLKTFYKRFFSQQFKRSCLPDGPKIGSVGVSPRGDLKMPSDADSREWLK